MAETQEAASRLRRSPVPLKTYFADVIRVAQLSPHMVRITIGGGDLHEFVSAAPDQFITFILPQPGQDRPQITRDLKWDEFRQMPDDIRPHARNYTVRYHRPEVAEIDVDFVVHGDEGAASAWALRAKPGDHLAIWGPRMAYNPPTDDGWQLLVGDETGLPAIGAIFDALPVGMRAHAFIEVADAAEQQELTSAAEVTVTWLYRDGVAAGESDLLIDAVRNLSFPAGSVYAWGGGEQRAMSAIKKYLHEERGLPNEAISILNYWRCGADH